MSESVDSPLPRRRSSRGRFKRGSRKTARHVRKSPDAMWSSPPASAGAERIGAGPIPRRRFSETVLQRY